MAAFDENVRALKQRLDCPLLGVLPFDQEADAKKLAVLLQIRKLDSNSPSF